MNASFAPLEVEGFRGAPGSGETAQRLTAGLLVLAFLSVVLPLVLVTNAGTGRLGDTNAGHLDTGALEVALGEVLVAEARVESAREEAPLAAELVAAERALEDAWATLSVVHQRAEEQAQVRAGTRPPLLGAPPPLPARVSREDALVRSALAYVRGGIEERDARAVERARDLLTLAERSAVSR